MTVIRDVAKELFGMFVADSRLTLAILLLVGLVAVLVGGLGIRPLFAGVLLLFGAITIIIEAVAREARAQDTPQFRGRR